MFRIKICGVTSVNDAALAVDAGADAIGLNFYSKSRRGISLDVAKQIANETDIIRVGVFVNQPANEMWQAWNAGGLWYAQIHGDETPEMLKPISEMDIIAVRRFLPGAVGVLADLKHEMLHFASVIGWMPQGILVDTASPGEYGGTGAVLNWHDIQSHEQAIPGARLILAGGLTPENVAEAIRIVRPAAVDVASGVESAPGKKDPIKVRDFIQAARAAFGE